MWIEKKDKKEFLDSDKHGLRLRFHKEVNSLLKTECVKFCKWLRQKYFFPIRIELRFSICLNFMIETKKEQTTTAAFHFQIDWGEKSRDEKRCPVISIATGKFVKRLRRLSLRDALYFIFFSIAHELTHYFQWYFYEFDKISDRSLEIESNRWADYLVSEYLIDFIE